jgi:hypothetical protein
VVNYGLPFVLCDMSMLTPRRAHHSSTFFLFRWCRDVLRDHLLALRWMNPNAVIYLREAKGQGTPQVEYELCECVESERANGMGEV